MNQELRAASWNSTRKFMYLLNEISNIWQCNKVTLKRNITSALPDFTGKKNMWKY